MIALITIESSTLRIDYGNSSMHYSSRHPSVAKFYVEPPCVGGTKVCLQHLGHLTKMAATLIYGEKKSSSPEPVDRYPPNLVCSIGDSIP